jgi:hypothetical protein
VAGTLRTASAATVAGHQPAASPAELAAHALATGFSRGFGAAAAIALVALLVALATIRVRRQDLAGAGQAQYEDAARQPAATRQSQDRAVLAAAARPCRPC